MYAKGIERLKSGGMSLVICISAAYCCGYIGCLLSPVTTELYDELAEAPQFWVNFVVSGASAVSIVFNFLAAFLSRYISKKKLHLTALLLFTLGGTGFVFPGSIVTYALCRTLCSIAVGIAFVTVPGIICQLYKDVRTRSRCFGVSNIVGTVIGMVFSLLAGAIAVRGSWHNVFYVSLVGVPVIILNLLLIPDCPPEREREEAPQGSNSPLNKPLLLSFIAGQFAMNIFYGVLYYLGDLYVSGTGIGDSMLTGSQMAIGMLCGALVSMSFAAVYRRLFRWTGAVSWLCTTLPFLALGIKASPALFVIFGSLSLGMVSLNYVYYQQKFSEIAPPGKATLFMSLNSAASVTGTSLSAYIPGIVRQAAGISDIRQLYLYLGGAMVLCTLLSAVCTLLIHDKTDRFA